MSLVHDPNDPHHLWMGLDSTPTTVSDTASDTIQLLQQNTNMIPDKSWVVNLFEIFTPASSNGSVELDLISEYTGKTRFVAIFMGMNEHYFALPVVVGHIYRRTVRLDRLNSRVSYQLVDMSTGMQESYVFPLSPGFPYQITDVFRGIEWHNLQGTTTFPVTWLVSLSPSVSFSSSSLGTVQMPTQQVPTPPSVTQMLPTSLPSNSSGLLLLGGIILGALVLSMILSSF
jgi:hypothetical protein